MNLEPIIFEKIAKGDVVFVSTAKNKKGEPLRVIDNIVVGRGYNERKCHKIVLENGDEHFGWAQRFLKRVVDNS